jgi:hypothetical protein
MLNFASSTVDGRAYFSTFRLVGLTIEATNGFQQ